ncbi:hypothetical protein [Streptomyces sp. JB150]|uniref:hypothetical protein n=1 Tax=Streptomyces sp. JB150 TaxID=2714844 RepID=UPI00140798E3|nr:hypothetical protein [Streptomyces sp. JB150]QIJ66324.1 hypothetical protein G7Z13_33195 [Streptomyces sp. JB150]
MADEQANDGREAVITDDTQPFRGHRPRSCEVVGPQGLLFMRLVSGRRALAGVGQQEAHREGGAG